MKQKRFLPDGIAVYGGLILLLLLGIAAFVFRQDFSFREKRFLAEAPQNFSPVRWTLNEDLETFLSDQIPFRNQLVNIDAEAQVLTGRAVQLEAWPAGDAIVEKPVREKAETLLRRTDAMKAFAGEIPCRFITPPTAGMLREGEMTAARRAVYEEERVLYDAVTAQEGFIPLKEAFEQSGTPVFYSSDHHWNSEGVRLAYRAYCRASGLEEAGEDLFTITEYTPFYGTTYTRSGLPFVKADTLVCAEPKAEITLRTSDGEEEHRLIFPEKAETYDGYEVYLNGNHGMVVIENPEGERGTLFVCKDSFANSLLPLLSVHYRRIVAVDARYYPGTFREALREAGDAEEILFVYSLDSLAGDTSLMRKLRD